VAPVLVAVGGGLGGGVLLSVAWVAVKVGALSYGGGFVIIPLMQSDAVSHYHWMTGAQFLNAVALGQVTPGPVVQTVAVVGYAAAGLAGGILASVVAFSPSFAFILLGAGRFDQIRGNRTARAFLAGAGPAAIGAIYGSAIPLTRALTHPWQYAVLAGALLLLLPLRRGVVLTLLSAGAAGVAVTLTLSTALS
jgi:chromate transporter